MKQLRFTTLGDVLLGSEDAAGATITAGTGLTQTGATIDVVGTANRIVVAADSIDIGTDVVTLTGAQTLTNKTLEQPNLVGGGEINSKITYKSTTGAGTSTGIAHQFVGGTNGAVIAATILNNGNMGIGATDPVNSLDIVDGTVNTGTGGAGANPGAFAMTSPDVPVGGGGGQAFITTNSAFGIDKGGSIGFGGRYGHATESHDTTFAKIKGAKENANMYGVGGYLTFATYEHNMGALLERIRITSLGKVGIGTITPTALLHLKAGTADTAQLKLNTGIALTTPEDGAIEYHSSHIYFTIGSTRYQLDQQGGGGIHRSIVVTSGNFTAGAAASTDYIYLIAGAHTMTLPTAVGNTNRYTAKNNHSANITIAATASQTIDGTTTISISPLSSVDLISDNAGWLII